MIDLLPGFGRRTLVIGVLNAADSLSGDGYGDDVAALIEGGVAMERDGADVLDVGAASSAATTKGAFCVRRTGGHAACHGTFGLIARVSGDPDTAARETGRIERGLATPGPRPGAARAQPADGRAAQSLAFGQERGA